MRDLKQTISLDPTKCSGCTNCIKRCPTSAIRVKDGKAMIIDSKCINCGACIRICPSNAFTGITHDLDYIQQFPYRVALIDPVLYSQFHEIFTPQQIIDGVKQLGFNDIYEISNVTELITSFTKDYIASASKLPIISSSCPAIIRLIQLRFHNLIDHILPIDSPVEISAFIARQKALKNYMGPEEEIGIFYISPCIARVFSFMEPLGISKTNVDGCLSIKSVFLMVSKQMSSPEESSDCHPPLKGIEWSRVEGQSKALEIKEYLAIDGIENVIEVLEEIEDNKINDLVFLECQACTNGCIGGSLTIENSFVARNRIRQLAEKQFTTVLDEIDIPIEKFIITEPIHPLYSTKLDRDLTRAIEKLVQIEKVLTNLPQIDCGACGSPSCRALAEDIVLGYARLEDCMVKFKEMYSEELENILKNKNKNRD